MSRYRRIAAAAGAVLALVVAPGVARIGHQSRAAQQRLRRHAAGVEAVAAHAVLFHQGHLRAHRGGDARQAQPDRLRPGREERREYLVVHIFAPAAHVADRQLEIWARAAVRADPQPDGTYAAAVHAYDANNNELARFWGRAVSQTFLALMKLTAFYQEPKRNLQSFEERFEAAARRPQKGGETGWILEANTAMNRAMEAMGGDIVKTFRIYEKVLAPQ